MSEKKSQCRLRVSGAENPGEDYREARRTQLLRLRLCPLRLLHPFAAVARLWTLIARLPRNSDFGTPHRLPTI